MASGWSEEQQAPPAWRPAPGLGEPRQGAWGPRGLRWDSTEATESHSGLGGGGLPPVSCFSIWEMGVIRPGLLGQASR